MSDMVSIVIPHRECIFAPKTVDDIYENARGPIEVIVVSDGKPLEFKDHPNLVIVQKPIPLGMRDSLNRGFSMARGKYIMKADDHCAFGVGFDETLKQHHLEDNWITIPSRYSLDPIKWERTRGPICYLYLTYPFTHHDLFGTGFHGSKWHGPKGLYGSYWHLENERRRTHKIDDLMVFQGSCYFMTKSHWEFMEGLDEIHHPSMYGEAIELDFKTWLSGGRVIINKHTWYAHLHKGEKWGNHFGLKKSDKYASEEYDRDYWLQNSWPKQTRPLKWLIDKFSPLDGWPEDWEEQVKRKYNG